MKRVWTAALAAFCLMVVSVLVYAQEAIPESGVAGKWHFVLDTPGGPRDFDAEFTVDAEGKIGGSFGKSTAVGSFKEGHLLMDFPATDDQSGETAQLKLDGKLEDATTLSGNWQFSSYDGTFRAFRPKKDAPSR